MDPHFQVSVRSYRASRTNGVNKFGDYEAIIHVMSRVVNGEVLGETRETFTLVSSVGAPPVVLKESEFKDMIVNAVIANTKAVEFLSI